MAPCKGLLSVQSTVRRSPYWYGDPGALLRAVEGVYLCFLVACHKARQDSGRGKSAGARVIPTSVPCSAFYRYVRVYFLGKATAVSFPCSPVLVEV